MTDLRTPDSHAILIGAGTYDSDALSHVPAVRTTVNALLDALRDRCGMDEAAITTLQDRPTARSVLEEVAGRAKGTTGVLLVYYVGHGLANRDGELLLAVNETEPAASLPERTAVPYADVARLLGESRAQAVIVILDCCFSGRALPSNNAGGRGPVLPAGRDGGFVLTSAARGEHALAPEGERYTRFTGQLLEFLKNGDPERPATEDLTLNDAYVYLRRASRGAGQPSPRAQSVDAAGTVVLTRNRGHRPAIDAAPAQEIPAPPADAPETTPLPGRTARPGSAGWYRRHRRGVWAGAGAAAAALLIAVTVLWPGGPGSGGSPAAAGKSPSATVSATASAITAACAAGSVTLIGSTAFVPIAQGAAAEYKRQCGHQKITITTQGGDSAYGISKAQDSLHGPAAGTVMAMYDGSTSEAAGLTPRPLGVMVIFSVVANSSLVAHDKNYADRNITTLRLTQLFFTPQGVPGEVAVGRQAGSGTRKAFLKILGLSEPGPVKPAADCPSKPPARAYAHPQCTEIGTSEALSFVNTVPNAISYARVYQLAAGGHPFGDPEVTQLDLDGAAPTAANVRNGSYRFVTPEYLYLPPHPSRLAADFVKFLDAYAPQHAQSTDDFVDCALVPQSLREQCA